MAADIPLSAGASALCVTDRPIDFFIEAIRRRRVASGRGRRQQTFVATLAHELRQPLSTMSTTLEMVRETAAAEASARLDLMQRQIEEMNRLVDDLLDAARWATGKVAVNRRRLDLRTVMSDAAQNVVEIMAERGHVLHVLAVADPMWIDADRQRLQQVLSSLLANAARRTESGGRISLTAAVTASTVTLCVADTGCGIPADRLPQVFDLFSQAGPLEGAGLGVGLSVVREIVALHGGYVEARSPGVGLGSEFLVNLPLSAFASRADPTEPRAMLVLDGLAIDHELPGA